MALSPDQNDGEARYAPGCDTANIPAGMPGTPYTWDADSHRLSLSAANFPTSVTDPQIRGGFRYLTIFLDGPGSVTIGGVSLNFTGAPLQAHPERYAGYFLSSDNELNKLWYAGAYTTQLNTAMPNTLKGNISGNVADSCWPYQYGEADHANGVLPSANQSQEVVFDGAKRDRDPFTGDMSVEIPVTELSTQDDSALTNTLDSFARQQLADGFVPGNGLQCPNDTKYFSGSYDLQFINDEYEYFLYSGDRDFIQHAYPALVKATAWARGQVDLTGLLSFSRYGKEGACGLYAYTSCDHLAYVNALYYETLMEMSALSDATGHPQRASQYSDDAAHLRAVINAKLWDAATGAYRMSLEHPDIFPQDASSLAIVTGIADNAQATSSLNYLRKHEWSSFGSLMSPPGTPSALMTSEYEPLATGLELTARLSDDRPDSARVQSGFQLMKTFWGYMLSQDPGGTFWEKTDSKGRPAIGSFTSLAHGWAAGPTVALTEQVLGMSPTRPGYESYSVQPHPGRLQWAQGLIPTPHGPLTVDWARESDLHTFRLEVTAPSGALGTYSVPALGKKSRVTVDGKTLWNDGKATRMGGLRLTSTQLYISIQGLPGGHHVVTVFTK